MINRKTVLIVSVDREVPIENIPTERSDRIQELINKTKEKLGGSTKD